MKSINTLQSNNYIKGAVFIRIIKSLALINFAYDRMIKMMHSNE